MSVELARGRAALAQNTRLAGVENAISTKGDRSEVGADLAASVEQEKRLGATMDVPQAWEKLTRAATATAQEKQQAVNVLVAGVLKGVPQIHDVVMDTLRSVDARTREMLYCTLANEGIPARAKAWGDIQVTNGDERERASAALKASAHALSLAERGVTDPEPAVQRSVIVALKPSVGHNASLEFTLYDGALNPGNRNEIRRLMLATLAGSSERVNQNLAREAAEKLIGAAGDGELLRLADSVRRGEYRPPETAQSEIQLAAARDRSAE